ncbi:hypothetical protein [Streptococcus hillyeri]|uniref:Phage protein n=1 Tax=Streptococcus hillyeri TaxID=2282420 RepID=A0A3L9DQ26_9STRE|nr:hypothetical protein [Streptococcus hillyeri]RLY03411.1 hypothetical protein EAF07_05130 [Streptococcus hillyeri]
MTTKSTQTGQVILSAKELKNLGSELTDIMNVIAMNNVALEGLEFSQKHDTTVALWLTRKYIDTAYSQNEKIFDRLDKIAFLLLNSNDAKELEAVKNDR